MHEINDFRLLCFSASSREFLQARKYLTNLRLFVKKKLFRSRRAPHAYTQMSKLQNMTKSCMKWSYYTDIMHNLYNFSTFVLFWLQQGIPPSQKIFDKSQIVCQEKIVHIPQSSSCLHTNVKTTKYDENHVKIILIY